jgi:hypothetical protein
MYLPPSIPRTRLLVVVFRALSGGRRRRQHPIRSVILPVTLLVSLLSIGPVAHAQGTPSASPPYVAEAVQDLPPLAHSGLIIEPVRAAFAGAGFQVDEPITWNWTAPPVTTLRVRDLERGRVLTVLVYPSAAAALTARLQAQTSEGEQKTGEPKASDRGPHLIDGFGESVWLGYVALVETSQSELDRREQLLIERDLGVYVDPERVRATSQPRFAVEQDFQQALTNTVANL